MTRKRTHRSRTWLALPLLVAVFLAAPFSASAVEIGSTNVGSSAPSTLGCTDNLSSCIQTQDQIAGDEMVNVVPTGGRFITRFGFRYATGSVALVVLRQDSGGNFALVGETGDVTGDGTDTTQSFTINPPYLAVQPGDFIGLRLGPGASLGVLNGAFNTNAWELSDVTSPLFIDNAQPYELLLDATVTGSTAGGGDDGGDGGGGVDTTPVPDPLAGLRAGQKPQAKILGKTLKASKKGVVRLKISNPNGFKLKGKVALKAGRLKLGAKSLSIAADSSTTVKIKLSRKAFRALKRKRKLRAVAIAKVRGPIGKARTVRKKLSVKAPPRSKARRRTGGGGGGGGGGTPPGGGGYRPEMPCRTVYEPGRSVYDPVTGTTNFVPGRYRYTC